MGCVCTKKNEISNMNLQDTNDGVPQVSLSNANLNETAKSPANHAEDAINQAAKKEFSDNNNNDIKNPDDATVRTNDCLAPENETPGKDAKKMDINHRVFECINRFRANPGSLADLLLEETKNISVTEKNGKEIYIYKSLYCINGKEELFIQVSNVLKTLDALEPLEFSAELALEPENVKNRKPVDAQDKLALQKEKEADYKQRVKSMKDKLSRTFQKIEILSHTTNEEIEDSIIMQIISNFNADKNSKVKRPFDLIFGSQFKNIGVQLSGSKKMNGQIIFAY